MSRIIDLQPHDPLPDGPAIVLMRRFEEDDPHQAMMELIVIRRDQSTHGSRLLTKAGTPLPWDEAEQRMIADGKAIGVARLYRIDRTKGPREQEIEAHGGDRSYNIDQLQDTDPEDGEEGSDMRDMGLNEAPRKF